ncbi:MAG: Yip1 family protein, partial [Bacteroidota bacterium]|nr:Yip1 family protein [Bacteroidota bacterium]
IVGSLATFIGSATFGLGHSIYNGFMSAIAYFISAVGGIYISAIVINELAPNFGSEKNLDKAFKLVIYASTASLLATIVASLHPLLSFVGLFGLYSIYIFWLGIGPMMKTPKDKKLGFVVISALIIIAIVFLLNLILTSILITSALS